MDANPYPSDFVWQIEPAKRRPNGNSKSKERALDVPAGDYSSQHDHSVLQYAPRTEADYGTALCWAVNEVGKQEEPCRFSIVKESAPDPLRKCKVDNVTWEVGNKSKRHIKGSCHMAFL